MSSSGQIPAGQPDPQLSLHNLITVKEKMDSLQRFITISLKNNSPVSQSQMDMVSSELISAIHQTILNGSALISSYTPNHPTIPAIHENPPGPSDAKVKETVNNTNTSILEDDSEIIELDAVELLAEHVHFCEICGKGFKRDANLRMHMRAHGDKFKTHEALAKPEKVGPIMHRSTRFSCPFKGCNRNKEHKKFKALKSVICVRNHFKRSHCPKMYSCNRCNKKNFSVLADLRSHLKHCGEAKWKCTCGTSFSRKDKLFGHVVLFEGHMPAVVEEEDGNGSGRGMGVEMEEDEDEVMDIGLEDEFFEGLGSIEGYSLEDVMDSSSGWNFGMGQFYDIRE